MTGENGHHNHDKKKNKRQVDGDPTPYYAAPRQLVSTFIFILLVLVGITALALWLIYRPHKPKFAIVSASIYDLNVTSPPYLSTTMQFTVITRNPNRRVSIYYDDLSAFVSYNDQPITPTMMLPPLYHDTKTTVALSPLLGGGAMPVSVGVANQLMMDKSYGAVRLRLVVVGRLRFRAGAIKTRHYGVYVKCDMLVGLNKGFVGQTPLPPLGYPDCKVDL